jgi:hypothetical protein
LRRVRREGIDQKATNQNRLTLLESALGRFIHFLLTHFKIPWLF